jgi:predicted SAM-dependent methyltransferase
LISHLKQFVFRHPALERAARRLLDLRYKLARRHLRGAGLEIGALDRPLFLPLAAKAYYLDRLLPAELYQHYPELSHRHFFVSMVGDGETLDCIRNASLDFLIANHVIEHTQDPIGTLKTFLRKLKPGGIIFMAVPDMRRTFDQHRTETSWEHLAADHAHGPANSRRAHYREWAEQVEGLRGTEAEARANNLMNQDYSIHFHCRTLSGVHDFLAQLSKTLPLRVAVSRSWRNENIFVIEKVR